jgi:hypothetical protein
MKKVIEMTSKKVVTPKGVAEKMTTKTTKSKKDIFKKDKKK